MTAAETADTTERPRVPTIRLDADVIINAGLSIAARPGATSMSVRELGTLLGSDPTAIYRHFRNKDDLMRALLDRVLGIAIDRISADPDDWRAFLRDMSQTTLDTFLEYPVIGAEAMRLSTEGVNELESVEGILRAFRAAGLDHDQVVRYYGVMSGFVLSFCSGIVRARSKDEDPLAASSWMDRPLSVTSSSHPEIHQSRDELLALDDRDIYAMGVELIIEAAARDGRSA